MKRLLSTILGLTLLLGLPTEPASVSASESFIDCRAN